MQFCWRRRCWSETVRMQRMWGKCWSSWYTLWVAMTEGLSLDVLTLSTQEVDALVKPGGMLDHAYNFHDSCSQASVVLGAHCRIWHSWHSVLCMTVADPPNSDISVWMAVARCWWSAYSRPCMHTSCNLQFKSLRLETCLATNWVKACMQRKGGVSLSHIALKCCHIKGCLNILLRIPEYYSTRFLVNFVWECVSQTMFHGDPSRCATSTAGLTWHC